LGLSNPVATIPFLVHFGILHPFFRAMDKLVAELEKKKEECELAANIGQMLLKENERLQAHLARYETGHIPAAAEGWSEKDFESFLPDEIQQSLLQQTRHLTQKLQDEYNTRIDRETKLENSLRELEKSNNRQKLYKQRNGN
jgi:hypothetical protein